MDKRKIKRIVKSRAKKLFVGSYAMGCREHPGVIVSRCYYPNGNLQDHYGADVEIQSLVDGNIESCSIYHCAPEPISEAYAKERAEFMKTHHAFDVTLKYSRRPDPRADIEEIMDRWDKSGCKYYLLHDYKGNTIRSNQVMTEEQIEEEIKRLSQDWFKERGISNLRKVDYLTYPAPPVNV